MTQSSETEEKKPEGEEPEVKVEELQEEAPATEEAKKVPEREPIPITISDIELERLQREASDYKDKYLRLLAESENSRKRLVKEKDEHLQHAVANVLVEFLGPLDHMEKALGFAIQGSDEVRNWAVGFEMVLNQFKEVLDSRGVVPMVTTGKTFDPHLHEAVEVLETEDQPAGLIIEEYTRGYIMGKRTLRPARVKVTRAPKPPAEEAVEPPIEVTENVEPASDTEEES